MSDCRKKSRTGTGPIPVWRFLSCCMGVPGSRTLNSPSFEVNSCQELTLSACAGGGSCAATVNPNVKSKSATTINLIVPSLWFQTEFVRVDEGQEFRYLDHVFADEPDAVRVRALDYAEVTQDFRGAVVLEADLELDWSGELVRFEFTNSLNRALCFVPNHHLGHLRHQRLRRVKPRRPLHDRTFDVPKQRSGFLHNGIVARNHNHRHVEMPGNRRVDPGF